MSAASTKASATKSADKTQPKSGSPRARARGGRTRASAGTSCPRRRGDGKAARRRKIVSPISTIAARAARDIGVTRNTGARAARHARAARDVRAARDAGDDAATSPAPARAKRVRSERKRAANRANAQRSTGPRTIDGKRSSRTNATTHGLFCKDLVLPGESRPLFLMMRRGFIERLRPQDLVELLVVERLVCAAWRLRRLQEVESWAHAAQGVRCLTPDEVERELNAGAPTPEVAAMRAHFNYRSQVPAALVTLNRLADENQLAERLSKYEQRLEYTIHRCLRELRALQKRADGDGADELPRSPFLDEVPAVEPEVKPEVKPDARETAEQQNHVAQPPPAVIPSNADAADDPPNTAEGGGATSPNDTTAPESSAAQIEPTAATAVDDESDDEDDDASPGPASATAAELATELVESLHGPDAQFLSPLPLGEG